jgi:hypothetical protein
MDQFESLFAKIGVINNGTFGSAVFSGDYMFSQYGIDADGNSVIDEESYKQFNSADPYSELNSFKPNLCFNFKTGKV